jgi:hypothetical protein
MGRLTGSAAFSFEISSVEMKGKEFIARNVFYLPPVCATIAVNLFLVYNGTSCMYVCHEDSGVLPPKWQTTH